MEREKRYATEGFHLGNLIKTELMRQGRSITWLASQVDCSRENLYKVFRHKWIYTDLLFQICKAWITTSLKSVPSITKPISLNKTANNSIGIFQKIGTNSNT